MKKIGLFLLLFIIIFYGCKTVDNNQQPATTGQFELVLITDGSAIDDNAFIRGTWEGLLRYARGNNISHKYYPSPGQSDEAYLSTIDLAVQNGAKLIVSPGYQFGASVFIAQDRYPDVGFILIDSVPGSADGSEYKTGNNSLSILYAEDQAGFLAGYAAVKDGYRRLGFIGGMAVPSVIRFGYGFIQGIEYAAEELRLAPGAITVKYHYTGDFVASPKTQVLAASWYSGGTEVIFACGGALGSSVMAAAEQSGKKVIGVDVDQSAESPSVITSAMKGLQASVFSSISGFYSGRFPGGQAHVFSAANNGVGLPMAASRFNSFSRADYDAVFRDLVNGSIPRIVFLDDAGSPQILQVTIIKIEEAI